jgi:hypothetical protein
MNKTPEQLEAMAVARANQILESWWYEDVGEYQDEEGLTDQELEQILAIPVYASAP